VLQCVAAVVVVRSPSLVCVAVCCGVLLCVAVCCSVLQRVTVCCCCCDGVQSKSGVLTVCCSVL